EASSARSPGYPSPPASPPYGIADDTASASSRKHTSMGPPAPVSRSASSASSRAHHPPQSMSGYTSMASAGVVLQQPLNLPSTGQSYASPHHPPSKLATGGQTHAHRPVSAMPTPTEHSTASSSRTSAASSGGAGNVFASMNGNYADRRASAHPTMTSSHTASGHAMVPAQMDSSTSQAISSGIPITSPAAISYFAAHPRRQQVHFGNYLLLQTLGEGEFGKVKLGVHKEWGEEVAVKLIKRDKVAATGAPLAIDESQKDPAKMSKVEREIQVLKDVRHPNIVRLYEVIESDRYIGIVLEYASGGELFDHILAHKYLKEEHACRLFAQLISGVSYLHQKKIIHRDLKLENLLLDRNRNVIITDFGFANNFEDRRDDLMATSCGSPCYAAPELVVQDGLYAGSAVDVWSCGVILYAMLAGYLPFDDDPANPDGDNINLLYKYILATPLSFPEYITAEPRDLLSKMLVPDPTRRATLEQVMQHSWLRNYRELFKFSVEDLERAAMEQQTKKRQIYRQQMLYQHQLQEQQRRQHLERSQSVRTNVSNLPVGTAYSTNAPIVAAPQRQNLPVSSTVPDRLFEPTAATAVRAGAVEQPATSTDGGATAAAAVPDLLGVPGSRSAATQLVQPMTLPNPVIVDPVTAQGNARGEPRTRLDEPAVAASSSQRKPSVHTHSPIRDGEQRKPAAQKVQRHTIQVEYGSDERPRKESATTAPSSRPVVSSTTQQARQASNSSAYLSDLELSKAAAEKLAAAAVPPSVFQPAPVREIRAEPVLVPESERITTVKSATSTGAVVPAIPAAVLPSTGSGRVEMMRSASGASATRVTVPSPILEQTTHTPSSSDAKVTEAGPERRTASSTSASPSGRVRVPSLASSKADTALDAGGRVVSNPLPAGEAVSFPPVGERIVSAGAAPMGGREPIQKASTTPRPHIASQGGSTVAASPAAGRPLSDKTAGTNINSTRHRKGMSTDKFFLSRLLGSSTNVARQNDENVNSTASSASAAGSTSPVLDRGSKRSSVRASVERAPSSSGRASRRKAMSLVVGRAPGHTAPATQDRTKGLEAASSLRTAPNSPIEPHSRPAASITSNASYTGSVDSSATSFRQQKGTNGGNSSNRPAAGSTWRQQQQQDSLFYDGSTIASTSTAGPSSSAAKKVMDWFRKKSLSRGTFNEQPPLGPFERNPASVHSPRSPVVASSSVAGASTSAATPSVIITGSSSSTTAAAGTAADEPVAVQADGTGAASSVPSSRSTSGTHSENSTATEATQLTHATSSSHPRSEGLKSSASTVQQQATPKASLSLVTDKNGHASSSAAAGLNGVSAANGGNDGSSAAANTTAAASSRPGQPAKGAFNESVLRYHFGAVDQLALTSRSPVEVLQDVQRVLYEMGIDFRSEKDEDFKLECVRRKRAKTLMSATQGLGMSIRSSVFPPSQAEVERSSRMSNRDSLTTSMSSAGGGSLRSFLRRGSHQSQQSQHSGATSPKQGVAMLPSSSTTSSQLHAQDENQPPTVYGSHSIDGGQEIRFSVEVTRIKNLPGLYSLDIRRMKGNLWAYKFVYHALLERCQLGS
ncbi:Pkinase-domain-containing protein, partial [Testicularia cyperi]